MGGCTYTKWVYAPMQIIAIGCSYVTAKLILRNREACGQMPIVRNDVVSRGYRTPSPRRFEAWTQAAKLLRLILCLMT